MPPKKKDKGGDAPEEEEIVADPRVPLPVTDSPSEVAPLVPSGLLLPTPMHDVWSPELVEGEEVEWGDPDAPFTAQGDRMSNCLPADVRSSVARWVRPAEFLAEAVARQQQQQQQLEAAAAAAAATGEGKTGEEAPDGAPAEGKEAGATADTAGTADGDAAATDGDEAGAAAAEPVPTVVLGDEEALQPVEDDSPAADAAGDGEEPEPPKRVLPRKLFRGFLTDTSVSTVRISGLFVVQGGLPTKSWHNYY